MKNIPSAIRVFAPATVANVGVGYDILGFPINGPGDEVVVRRRNSPGILISKITGTTKVLPYEVEKNTAGFGVQEYLKHIGKKDLGIDLAIHKKMPFGSGMGSSAASAAAAVFAVNELLGRPLEKKELVPFVVLGESAADGAIHGDNVIPSLLGGIILIRDNASHDFVKLPVPPGICVFIIYPEIEILTRDARAVLTKNITMEQFKAQTGNLASFVASLYTLDFELMRRSLKDHVIEPQRASLIPHFYEMQNLAMQHGAMNYTISGAGPSMFGFCENSVIAENASQSICTFLSTKTIPTQSFISSINVRGTYRM